MLPISEDEPPLLKEKDPWKDVTLLLQKKEEDGQESFVLTRANAVATPSTSKASPAVYKGGYYAMKAAKEAAAKAAKEAAAKEAAVEKAAAKKAAAEKAAAEKAAAEEVATKSPLRRALSTTHQTDFSLGFFQWLCRELCGELGRELLPCPFKKWAREVNDKSLEGTIEDFLAFVIKNFDNFATQFDFTDQAKIEKKNTLLLLLAAEKLKNGSATEQEKPQLPPPQQQLHADSYGAGSGAVAAATEQEEKKK